MYLDGDGRCEVSSFCCQSGACLWESVITVPFPSPAPTVILAWYIKGHPMGWANGLVWIQFWRWSNSADDRLQWQLHLHLSLRFMVNYIASIAMKVARTLFRSFNSVEIEDNWSHISPSVQGYLNFRDRRVFIPNIVTARKLDALEVTLGWSENNFTRCQYNWKNPSKNIKN